MDDHCWGMMMVTLLSHVDNSADKAAESTGLNPGGKLTVSNPGDVDNDRFEVHFPLLPAVQ